jgi:hypothetical protein
MPLYLDQTKPADLSWETVQIMFKGKPAFSIEADGYKHERPKLVFGISRLHPDASSNCQDCHFIHESVFTLSDRFRNPWDRTVTKDEQKFIVRKNDLTSQLRNLGFSGEYIPTFHENISVKRGLWTGVYDFLECFPRDGEASMGVLNPDNVSENMRNIESNDLMKTIKGTFAGCRDCNSKMTVNTYISHLFKLLIQSDDLEDMQVEAGAKSGSAKRKRVAGFVDKILKKDQGRNDLFDDEKMMFYVLLCGMIEDGDTIDENRDDGGEFYAMTIKDDLRCASWRFRFVLLWCLLQILFSVWENSKTRISFRHHLSYVYQGIQDFYLSFIFFSLHCANGSTLFGGNRMQFYTFHFFYSSHLPFFLMDGAGNPHFLNSLSSLVLKDCTFNFQKDIGVVRSQFDQLKLKVKQFWVSHVKPLSDFIHGRQMSFRHSHFFSSPQNAMLMSESGERIPLNVESFSRFFTGGPGYWFHFKRITMCNIEADCKLYFETERLAMVKQLWAQWYKQLCSRIMPLGINPPVRSRLAAVHLSAVLREIGGSGRWRRQVV